MKLNEDNKTPQNTALKLITMMSQNYEKQINLAPA